MGFIVYFSANKIGFRSTIATRQSIVSLFLGRFTLSEDEKEAITSRDIPVGERFFQAMDKTEKIRDDCRVLMTGEDGPTKAGYVSPFVMVNPAKPFAHMATRFIG